MTIKEFAKKVIKSLPIAFTQNQKYDKQTQKIIQKNCLDTSNCIDIGAHKGEILDLLIKYSPNGRHYAFEPIPEMYDNLKEKYQSDNIKISDIALSDKKGENTFNHVVSNPSYSGLKKRKYDHPNEVDQVITVQTDMLDNIIPTTENIDLIKIDVEGGEFDVLKGAKNTIARCKPIIIFEHGLGASEFYDAKPELLYDFLDSIGMKISLLKDYLSNKQSLSKDSFSKEFYESLNYYFVATSK